VTPDGFLTDEEIAALLEERARLVAERQAIQDRIRELDQVHGKHRQRRAAELMGRIGRTLNPRDPRCPRGDE
jgi:hypothetical protein